MENLKIKITGGGTRKDIANALELIAKSIRTTRVEDLDGCEWEDCTLMTEVEADSLVDDLDPKYDSRKAELVDKVFNLKFKDDDPKYDISNLAYLNALSEEELEKMLDEY